MTIEDIENILDVYSLEEVLEFNDITVEDVLYYLVEDGFLKLPSIMPL